VRAPYRESRIGSPSECSAGPGSALRRGYVAPSVFILSASCDVCSRQQRHRGGFERRRDDWLPQERKTRIADTAFGGAARVARNDERWNRAAEFLAHAHDRVDTR